MSLTIHVADPECSYATAIERFLAQEFPANLDDHANLLDALTAAFVASGQTRQGPAPSPESLVRLREHITYFITMNRPVEIVVPWGSRKPDNGGVDIAELFAMKQLLALDTRVRKYWPAGTHVSINVEDIGGAYLWPDLPPSLFFDYTKQMTTLARLASNYGPLYVSPESNYTTMFDFTDASERVRPYLESVLLALNSAQRNAALASLEAKGWVGDLPDAQVDFYLRQYARHYPEQTRLQHLQQLARYFAQSYARYVTKARGDVPHAIFVNFPQPAPGSPASLFLGRVFYRTLPMRFARTHIPPWRAKGYLRVTTNEITPKLSSYHELPPDLQRTFVEFSAGADRVVVQADHVIAD